MAPRHPRVPRLTEETRAIARIDRQRDVSFQERLQELQLEYFERLQQRRQHEMLDEADELALIEAQVIGLLESPGSRVRVAKRLADGGDRGRWIVIFQEGEDAPGTHHRGYFSKAVARDIVRARRQLGYRRAWMFNIDRSEEELSAFIAEYGLGLWPWMARDQRWWAAWTDKHTGIAETAGPMNLLVARIYWLHLRQDRQLTPVVIDLGLGAQIVYPRNLARDNPTGEALSGRTSIATAEGRTQVVMVRPVITGPDGTRHRPRVYLPAAEADPTTRAREVVHAAARLRRSGGTAGGEVVPKKRRPSKK